MAVYKLNNQDRAIIDNYIQAIAILSEDFNTITLCARDSDDFLKIKAETPTSSGYSGSYFYSIDTKTRSFCNHWDLSDHDDRYDLAKCLTEALFDTDEDTYIYKYRAPEPEIVIDPNHGDPLLVN